MKTFIELGQNMPHELSSVELTNPRHELIEDIILSECAERIRQLEYGAPVTVHMDESLRIKVIDQCGMACSFCHNEGTPVAVDNRNRSSAEFTDYGNSGRRSIYLNTNGANFVPAMIEADTHFLETMQQMRGLIDVKEVHLTGGEPTLHPRIVELVSMLRTTGLEVKITSNGERFYALADRLQEAGLTKVVFSIFGTTPAELAGVQGPKYSNAAFAELKLTALSRSIAAAHERGISAAANIVMPSSEHAERVKRVIDTFGSMCKVRILNSLDGRGESYAAIYELLAGLEAEPIGVNLNAGASGMSVDYRLPDGREIGFKQIRRSYLETSCGTCSLRDTECEEGFYGVRMYKDTENRFRAGVCIQRMDMTQTIDDFAAGILPAAIRRHRLAEYSKMMDNI